MCDFNSWDHFYQDELSWTKFLRNISDYDLFLECIIDEIPHKVLEVGCGPANASIFLSYQGIDCTAVDNNKTVLAIARRNNDRFHGHVHFMTQDAFSLDFSDDSFDLVHHSGFLEHFSDEDILRLLQEQLRIARKVVFTVPSEYYPRRDFGDERLLSRCQWEALLRNFKLEISDYFLPSYSFHVIPLLLWEGFNRLVVKRDLRKPLLYLAKISRPVEVF